MPITNPPGAGILPADTAQLIAVGDVGDTVAGSDTAGVAALVAKYPLATIQLLGDTAYPQADSANLAAKFTPTWSRFLGRTKPCAGNHDEWIGGGFGNGAVSPNAVGPYFGGLWGDATNRYYDYPLNQYWQVVVCNSETGFNVSPSGTSAGSTQEAWLRGRLAALVGKRVIVAWHRARWSSGSSHGSNTEMTALWQTCADFGVALVLSGHDHLYERHSGLNSLGLAGNTRQMIAGTGGTLLDTALTPLASSQATYTGNHGVLALTLTPTGYSWQFVDATGGVQDGGTATCAAVALPTAYDSFTGTDATALGSHTSDSGHTWTVETGAAALSGNALVASAFTFLAVLNPGIADVIVSARVNMGSSDAAQREVGLVLREQDTTNRLYVRLGRNTVGGVYLDLIKRVAGSDTTLGSGSGVVAALNTTYTLSVRASGSAVAVYLDGVQKIAVTESTFQTATKCGVRWAIAAGTGAFIDTFAVTPA